MQFVTGIPLTGKGFLYFIIFNGCCSLSYISFLRAAFTDPGRIQEGMTAPFQSEFQENRNCIKCPGLETWKPVRAYHCKECGFCVFKMDHHCPWINNCVGHRNTKFFIQLLLYIMLASLTLAFLCALSLYNLLTSPNSRIHMSNQVSSLTLSV